MQKYKSINSFTQNPSCAQIISYFLYVTKAVLFYALIQSNYENQTTRITTIIIYSIVLVSHLGVTLMVSLIDPSDELMVKSKNQPQVTQSQQILLEILYCEICQSYVKSQSRHCKLCGRCVQTFDHHCMWINNCIGDRNYKPFILMIFLSFISFLTFIVCMALLWIQNLYQNYIIQMSIVWAYSIVSIVFAILLFNLILFHIYLACLGITTFDFIMRNRQKDIDKQNIKYNSRKSDNKLQMTEQNLCLQKNKQGKTIEFEDSSNNKQKQYCQVYKIEAQSQEQSKKSHTFEANKSKLVQNDGGQKINVFDVREESVKNEQSAISQYFSKSKSLKILMSSAAVVPQVRTCKTKKHSVVQSLTVGVNNKMTNK